MVAGGWMKINNFHSCIMPPWNIASWRTMQFIQSIRSRGIFPFSYLQLSVCAIICEKWWLSESGEPCALLRIRLHTHTHTRAARLISFFRSYSFKLLPPLLLYISTRSPTLDPIRATEELSRNYINANVFSRRPYGGKME